MKLQQVSSVLADKKLAGWAGDYRVEERQGGFSLASEPNVDGPADLTVWVAVDPAGLSVEVGGPSYDGSPPIRGIRVPEMHALFDLRSSALRVLSFASGCTLTARSATIRPELIPEYDSDANRIAALHSLPVWLDTWASFVSHPPELESLDEEAVGRLLDREVGLALYLDARRMTSSTGSFREFWKVLESAFGMQNDDLVRLLASFPPAADLEFDASEIKRLLVLRGRASHAESSAGLGEYRTVSDLAAEALPRLRTLAEVVLVTKRSWGTKGTGVESLGPLPSYVNNDGAVVAIPRAW